MSNRCGRLGELNSPLCSHYLGVSEDSVEVTKYSKVKCLSVLPHVAGHLSGGNAPSKHPGEIGSDSGACGVAVALALPCSD